MNEKMKKPEGEALDPVDVIEDARKKAKSREIAELLQKPDLIGDSAEKAVDENRPVRILNVNDGLILTVMPESLSGCRCLVEAGELWLVKETVAKQARYAELYDVHLVVGVKYNAKFPSVFAVKRKLNSGPRDYFDWTTRALQQAIGRWGRICFNGQGRCKTTLTPMLKNRELPDWTGLSAETVILDAFGERVIKSLEHPLIADFVEETGDE